MGVTSWYLCTANENNSGVANPENMYADDASRAVFTSNDYVTAYNFSIGALPSGATPTGIEFKVNGYGTLFDSDYRTITLTPLYSARGSLASAQSIIMPKDTEGDIYAGGDTAEFSRMEWSATDFNNTNFGVKLSVGNITTASIYIDAVSVRVHYTLATPTSWYSPSDYNSNNGVVNPGNAYSDNGVYADFNLSDNIIYKTFEISIPSGNLITGIEIAVNGYADSSTSGNNLLTLTPYYNSIGSPASSIIAAMPVGIGSENWVKKGNHTDDWGRAGWVDTDFSDANFGIKVESLTVSASKHIWLDHLKVRVWHTADSATGWKSPSENENNSGWDNPSNTYSSDNSYAVSNANAENVMLYNFSLGVPSGATIRGMEVSVEGKQVLSNGTCYLTVQPFYNGRATGAATLATPVFTTSDVLYHVGGESELWDYDWTTTDLSDTNFGLKIISGGTTPTYTQSIDQVQVQVWYTASGSLSLEATVVANSSMTAEAAAEKTLSAAVAATSSMTASAAAEKTLSAAVAANSTMTASATAEKTLSAAVVATSSMVAEATAEKSLAAAVVSSSSVVAEATAEKTLGAAVVGTSSMTASAVLKIAFEDIDPSVFIVSPGYGARLNTSKKSSSLSAPSLGGSIVRRRR